MTLQDFNENQRSQQLNQNRLIVTERPSRAILCFSFFSFFFHNILLVSKWPLNLHSSKLNDNIFFIEFRTMNNLIYFNRKQMNV